MSSRIPGFYKLPPDERLRALGLSADDAVAYRGGLSLEAADLMVENVFATFALPCAAAVNFVIDGVERVVPMVVEEPSVVAAVSNVARLARGSGGFVTRSDPSHMLGQVQLADVTDPGATVARLRAAIPLLTEAARGVHPRLEERGGGLVSIDVRHVVYDEPGKVREDIVVLEFVLDVVDAMGANMVNTLAETLAPLIAELTGEQVGLKILSNLADRRVSRAEVRLPNAVLAVDGLDGALVAARIASAWRFAWADPWRACTHNKGVMNGIDAVALATGNDWRAIEAGAHAYAARSGTYRPLTRWELDGDRDARRHDRGAAAVRHGRRPDQGAPDGAGEPAAPGGDHGARAGGGRRGGGPRAEPRRAQGPGDRGHPGGAHADARPHGGGHGGGAVPRGRAGHGRAVPPQGLQRGHRARRPRRAPRRVTG
jgi:hydroxymethylglutaryl-CoA reductase